MNRSFFDRQLFGIFGVAFMMTIVFVGVWRFDQVQQFFSRAASEKSFSFSASGFIPNENIATWVGFENGTAIALPQKKADSSGRVSFDAAPDDKWIPGTVRIVAHGTQSKKEQFQDYSYNPPPKPIQNSVPDGKASGDSCQKQGGESGPVVVEKWRANASEEGGGHCELRQCNDKCCFTSCQCSKTCGAEFVPYIAPPTENGNPSLQGSADCAETAPDSAACAGDRAWGDCIKRTNGDAVQCGFEASNAYLTKFEELKNEAKKSENPALALAQLEEQTKFDKVETYLRRAAACKDEMGKPLVDKNECLDKSGKQVELPTDPKELEKVVNAVFAGGGGCDAGGDGFAKCVAQSGGTAIDELKSGVLDKKIGQAKLEELQKTFDFEKSCVDKTGKKVTDLLEFEDKSDDVFGVDCGQKKLLGKDDFLARKTAIQVAQINAACEKGSSFVTLEDNRCFECATKTTMACTVAAQKVAVSLCSAYLVNGERDYTDQKSSYNECLRTKSGDFLEGKELKAAKIFDARIWANAKEECVGRNQHRSFLPDGTRGETKSCPGGTVCSIGGDCVSSQEDSRRNAEFGVAEEFCEKQPGTSQTGCKEKYTEVIKNGFGVDKSGAKILSTTLLAKACVGIEKYLNYEGVIYDCEKKTRVASNEVIALRENLKKAEEKKARIQEKVEKEGRTEDEAKIMESDGCVNLNRKYAEVEGKYYYCDSGKKVTEQEAGEIEKQIDLLKKHCSQISGSPAALCFSAYGDLVLNGGSVSQNDGATGIIGSDSLGRTLRVMPEGANLSQARFAFLGTVSKINRVNLADLKFGFCQDKIGAFFGYEQNGNEVIGYCSSGSTFTKLCDEGAPGLNDCKVVGENVKAVSQAIENYKNMGGTGAVVPNMVRYTVFGEPVLGEGPIPGTSAEVENYCRQHPFGQVMYVGGINGDSGETARTYRCYEDGKFRIVKNFADNQIGEAVVCTEEEKKANAFGCDDFRSSVSVSSGDKVLVSGSYVRDAKVSPEGISEYLLEKLPTFNAGGLFSAKFPDCSAKSPIANSEECLRFRNNIKIFLMSQGLPLDASPDCRQFSSGGTPGSWTADNCARFERYVRAELSLDSRTTRFFWDITQIRNFNNIGGGTISNIDPWTSFGINFAGQALIFGTAQAGAGSLAGLTGSATAKAAAAGYAGAVIGGITTGMAITDWKVAFQEKSETLKAMGIPCDVDQGLFGGMLNNAPKFSCGSDANKKLLVDRMKRDEKKEFRSLKIAEGAVFGGFTKEEIYSAVEKASD